MSFGRTRAKEVEVAADHAAGPDCIRTGRDRLVQVLLNLGLNAVDAIDGSGALRFTATKVSRPDGGLDLQIDVVDTGPGVPADLAVQVFDPFFTTKPPGRGTGLGLYVSARTAEALGGRVELVPTPERGATFRLTLPACGCTKPEVNG